MKKIRPFVLVLALMLGGCTGVIPSADKPRSAPLNADKATVYLFNGTPKAALDLSSHDLAVLDGDLIGPLPFQAYTWFYHVPGIYSLSINDPWLKSRKLAATKIELKPGMVYFVRYKVISFKSDGALLGEIVSGAAKNADSFDSEDIQFLAEDEAKRLMGTLTFVGNRFQGANQSPKPTPGAVH